MHASGILKLKPNKYHHSPTIMVKIYDNNTKCWHEHRTLFCYKNECKVVQNSSNWMHRIGTFYASNKYFNKIDYLKLYFYILT